MRAIYAEALEKQLLDYFTYSMQLCAEISDFIDNAPTIVRCKDCIWRDDYGHWLGCPVLNTDDDNYCSYAERKTDEKKNI